MATVPSVTLAKIPVQTEPVVEVDTTGRAPQITGRVKRTWFQFFQGLAYRGWFTTVDPATAVFTASGTMSWTVSTADQTTFAYTLSGKTLAISVELANTSVTAPLSNELQVPLPIGFTAQRPMLTPAYISDNGTATIGTASVVAGGLYISVKKVDGSNFAASVNNTSVAFVFPFEIQG